MLVRNLRKKGDYKKSILAQEENLRLSIANDQNVSDARKKAQAGIIPELTPKQSRISEQVLTDELEIKSLAMNNLLSIFTQEQTNKFLNGDGRTKALSQDDLEYLNIFWEDLKPVLKTKTGLTLKFFRDILKKTYAGRRANYGYSTERSLPAKSFVVNTLDELNQTFPRENVLNMAIDRARKIAAVDPRAAFILKDLTTIKRYFPTTGDKNQKIPRLPQDKQSLYYKRFQKVFDGWESNVMEWNRVLEMDDSEFLKEIVNLYPAMTTFEQDVKKLYDDLKAEPDAVAQPISVPTPVPEPLPTIPTIPETEPIVPTLPKYVTMETENENVMSMIEGLVDPDTARGLRESRNSLYGLDELPEEAVPIQRSMSGGVKEAAWIKLDAQAEIDRRTQESIDRIQIEFQEKQALLQQKEQEGMAKEEETQRQLQINLNLQQISKEKKEKARLKRESKDLEAKLQEERNQRQSEEIQLKALEADRQLKEAAVLRKADRMMKLLEKKRAEIEARVIPLEEASVGQVETKNIQIIPNSLESQIRLLERKVAPLNARWIELGVPDMSRSDIKTLEESDPTTRKEIAKLAKQRSDIDVKLISLRYELESKQQEDKRRSIEKIKKELSSLPDSNYKEASDKLQKIDKYLETLSEDDPSRFSLEDIYKRTLTRRDLKEKLDTDNANRRYEALRLTNILEDGWSKLGKSLTDVDFVSFKNKLPRNNIGVWEDRIQTFLEEERDKQAEEIMFTRMRAEIPYKDSQQKSEMEQYQLQLEARRVAEDVIQQQMMELLAMADDEEEADKANYYAILEANPEVDDVARALRESRESRESRSSRSSFSSLASLSKRKPTPVKARPPEERAASRKKERVERLKQQELSYLSPEEKIKTEELSRQLSERLSRASEEAPRTSKARRVAEDLYSTIPIVSTAPTTPRPQPSKRLSPRASSVGTQRPAPLSRAPPLAPLQPIKKMPTRSPTPPKAPSPVLDPQEEIRLAVLERKREEFLKQREARKGKGISLKPTTFIEFGKFKLNENMLEEGTLQVKTLNGSPVPAFSKKVAISDTLQAILMDLIETHKLRGVSDLDDEERRMLETLLIKAGLAHGLGVKKIHQSDEDAIKVKRFDLVKGIYEAGNNSVEVIHELRSLILYFIKTKRLDKKAGMEALQELQ